MPRGTPLTELLAMYKAEVGADGDSAVAPGGDAVSKVALANQQKWLVNNYDWPFLKLRSDVALIAGTRYYDLPPTMNFDRPVEVKVKQATIWVTDPVNYGINEEQFQNVDSDTGVQADPVTRWDKVNVSGVEKIEVWPIPQSAQTLRFVGQRLLNPLTDLAHTTDLDDLLIVYFTAAELLARAKQGDAQAKLAKAQARMNQLRGSSPSQFDRFILGGGSTQTVTYNNRPRVTHG